MPIPDSQSGEITIGFVPTTLQTLLPTVLDRLTTRFPRLSVRVSSGLSGDLAARVEDGRLDYAFLTAPASPAPGLRLIDIALEPLCLIAPPGTELPDPPLDLLVQLPLIGFSRATWLGTQIAALLHPYHLPPSIELDSIDAVENLVALGFGASVVPQRLHAPPLGDRMACVALPGAARRLMLAAHPLRRPDHRQNRACRYRLIRQRTASRGFDGPGKVR